MNKIINHLKNILAGAIHDILKDPIKAFIVALISFVSTFITIIFGEDIFNILKKWALKVLTYDIQIWMALLIILLLYVAQKIYIFQKSKSKHNFVKYGLKWVTEIKKRKVVKIQGPFCTKCGYQLSDSDIPGKNQCPKCSKKYPENENNVEDVTKKVSSIVESDLRVGNVLNIDWSIFDYPNSKFSISNSGSFIVKNINVDINIDVNGKPHHIDTYSIDNIPSDETKKIDDSDPMNKINQIFNDLKLIKSKEYVFEDFTEDERGRVTYFDREIEWNELMIEFSSKLNIDMKYSLGKKEKSTKTKYSLKFKHINIPPEYPDYIDNFRVSLTEIE